MSSSAAAASIAPRALSRAAAVAVALLVLAGAGYRALADRLGRLDDAVTLAPGTLAAIPLEIDGWQGRDIALDPAVIRATDTDDHVNREYTLASAGRGVALYIAYGIRLRDLAPHRPEVCYPSAGWTLERATLVEVPFAEGGADTAVPVQIHSFRRTGLQASRLIVLSYYIVGGEYSPDVSLLRSTQWKSRGDGPAYAAQVQIACAATVGVEAAEQTVQEFAAVAAPVIRASLEAAVNQAQTAQTVEMP